MDVQREQIDQLVSFIQRTHNPSNFILVAGDFNLDAGSGYYEELRGRLEDTLGLELEDVWTRYAQSRYKARIGKTDNPAECQEDHGFADDGIGGTVNDSGRIDYIFVQKPCDSHDITVDVSRPRRRHFPRQPSAPGYDQIQYLSDHTGIELKLFFARK
jgi:endonuclease/exonuclease/phosphatase family metal-dependent hydrolase